MGNDVTQNMVIRLQTFILWLSRYWFLPAILVILTVLALAFLAPAFMSTGDTATGTAIYRILMPHDHQLPQRSYFLFGETGEIQSYSEAQILAWGAEPDNLRAFVGNPEIGFKTALNHRMIAIFTGMFLGGLIWQIAGGRPRLRPIPFFIITLPLLLDGISHMDSDASDGYRLMNTWAVTLTGGAFPETFYAGTTIGTLNWLLRTLTGGLFGLGLVWFLFTYFSNRFALVQQELAPKLQRIAAKQSKT